MIPILKFIHLVAISFWAGGLIGLPFLLSRRRRMDNADDLERLHRLVRFVSVGITSPAAFLAIASGIVLIFAEGTFEPWFALKLTAVGAMVALHLWTGFVVLGLFAPGGRFGAIAGAALIGGSATVVALILWIVLAKPAIDAAFVPDGLFEPGALGDWFDQSFGDNTMPTP
ncbi:CopD family protein [Fodinicurvata sp. EGI_FJ10296]|uniref:CopD family protein n=1 Tax=Fodinicurvata sp. EGI_FJ10296 TaxID=3231908 RepID=UPI0034553580